MANTFKNAIAENISNSSTLPTVVLRTPNGNSDVAVVVGLQVANTSSAEITATGIVASHSTTTHHKVTVATSSGNPAFKINDSFTPTITLKKGHTYIFDVSDSSVSGHLFKFSSATPSGAVTDITDGYTAVGTAGTKGAYVQWVVPASTTAAWFYCATSGHTANNKMNTAPTAFTIAADTNKDFTLFKDVPVPANSMMSVLVGDKVILEENDELKVYASASNAANVFASYLHSNTAT